MNVVAAAAAHQMAAFADFDRAACDVCTLALEEVQLSL